LLIHASQGELEDVSKRLKSSPDDDSRDEYLAIDDWLEELHAVPPIHLERMSAVLSSIKSRLEELIAMAEGSSESDEDEGAVIRVKRRSTALPEPPIDVDEEPGAGVEKEAEIENTPPVSVQSVITTPSDLWPIV
jgi:hypothetical protein